MGHFFLEVQADLAARIQARIDAGEDVTPGERGIVDDTNILLAWLGVRGSENMTPLDEWHSLDIEAKRPMHEQWARGFEAYSFEGNAPSIELQRHVPEVPRVAAVGLQGSMKTLNVTLTDDVRGVMDRMLASNEAIQEAEAARRMGPCSRPPKRRACRSTSSRPTMPWPPMPPRRRSTNYKPAACGYAMVGQCQDKAQGVASPIQEPAQWRACRDSWRGHEPAVYRAWQFLTSNRGRAETAQPDAKVKADLKALDVVEDSLFKAIAKLGGLTKTNRQPVGCRPQEKIESGVFGTPVLRKSGRPFGGRYGGTAYRGGLPAAGRERHARCQCLVPGRSTPSAGLAGVLHLARVPAAQRRRTRGRHCPITSRLGKLSTGALTEQYGAKDGGPLAKLQALKMTSEARGHPPDMVAETFGFSSDGMVSGPAGRRAPASVIEGPTNQRMLERYGDLGTLEGLTRQQTAPSTTGPRALRGHRDQGPGDRHARAGPERRWRVHRGRAGHGRASTGRAIVAHARCAICPRPVHRSRGTCSAGSRRNHAPPARPRTHWPKRHQIINLQAARPR